ncbi:MAG: guanylate kinase [Actinomycetota bacterium]|nr:guanylate kinase [Actinomycetota bacterium]
MGKDTIVSRLLEREPGLEVSRSWTTRPQRPGEPDDAYVFVDRDAFEKRIEEEGFLEWVEYLGNLYGTPMPEDDDHDRVLVIEVEGAAHVLERVDDAVMVLVVPPSPDALGERMRARGDDEAHVAERVARAVREEEAGRRLAHHVVVNEDLEQAVEEMARIIGRYRTPAGT